MLISLTQSYFKTSLLCRVLGVLACFCALGTRMVACSACLSAYVFVLLARLTCSLANVSACLLLTCSLNWRACKFACLAYLLVLCPYALTCLTFLLCSNTLRACALDVLFFFYLRYFKKLNSKNPYIEKFVFIHRST